MIDAGKRDNYEICGTLDRSYACPFIAGVRYSSTALPGETIPAVSRGDHRHRRRVDSNGNGESDNHGAEITRAFGTSSMALRSFSLPIFPGSNRWPDRMFENRSLIAILIAVQLC